jgi:hypothetical protein
MNTGTAARCVMQLDYTRYYFKQPFALAAIPPGRDLVLQRCLTFKLGQASQGSDVDHPDDVASYYWSFNSY